MNHEEAYQLALKVYMAGMRGEPMPDVPKGSEDACKRLWQRARKAAYIK